MPIVIARGRRPVARRPVMTGLAVGGAVAMNRNRRAAQQQMQMQQQQQIAQANAQASMAQAEAERARAEAEAAKRQAQQQQQPPQQAQAAVAAAPGMQVVNVVVPAGVGPGMSFQVQFGGANYTVACPANAAPGVQIAVQVPAQPQAVAVAAPTLAKHASSGRDLFREAMLDDVGSAPSAPPPAAVGAPPSSGDLILTSDHFVDENSPQMRQFGIIAVGKGTAVQLVEGDLVNGLGGGYKDYIKVLVPSQGGRSGLISRLVVAPAGSLSASAGGPPPAIGQ